MERCRLALSWAEAVPSRIVDKGHVDLGVRGGKGGVEGVATVDGKAASTDYKPEDVAFAESGPDACPCPRSGGEKCHSPDP